MKRPGRSFAQLLTEELQGVAGIVAQGDECLRREDEGWRMKGVDYRRLVFARGVADAALRVSKAHYGQPRVGIVRQLTAMKTRVRLSRSEVRSLISADLGDEALKRRLAELARPD
jgi:hypothetical protein